MGRGVAVWPALVVGASLAAVAGLLLRPPAPAHADTRYVSFPISYYTLVQSGVVTYTNQVVGYRFHWQLTKVQVQKTEYRWTRTLSSTSSPPQTWTQQYIRVGQHWEYRVTWGWQTVTQPVATVTWTLQNNVYRPQTYPSSWAASWSEDKPPSSGSTSTGLSQLSWGENRPQSRWLNTGTMINNVQSQWWCTGVSSDIRTCSGANPPGYAWTYGPPSGGLPPAPRDNTCWNWNVPYASASASGYYAALNDGTWLSWSSSFRYYEEIESYCTYTYCLVDFYQTTRITYTTGWRYSLISAGVPDYWTNYNPSSQGRSASGSLSVSGWYVSGVPSFSLTNSNWSFQVWAPTGQWVLVDDYAWVEYPQGPSPFNDCWCPVTVTVEEPRFTLVAKPIYGTVQVPQMTWQLTSETVSVPVTIGIGAWPGRGVQGIPAGFWATGQVTGVINTTVTTPSGKQFNVRLTPDSYTFSWGDGTPSTVGSSPGAVYPPNAPSYTHAYGSAGTYTVGLSVPLSIAYWHASWSPNQVAVGSQAVSTTISYPVDPPAFPSLAVSPRSYPSRGIHRVPAQFWAVDGDGNPYGSGTLPVTVVWGQNGYTLQGTFTPQSFAWSWGDTTGDSYPCPGTCAGSPQGSTPTIVHAYTLPQGMSQSYTVGVTGNFGRAYAATSPSWAATSSIPYTGASFSGSMSFPVDPPQPPLPGLGIGVTPDPGIARLVASQFWATDGAGNPYDGNLPYYVGWSQNGYTLQARYSPVSAWRWTWGDGSPPEDAAVPGAAPPQPATVSHTYMSAGTYSVSLTVTMGWDYRATAPSGLATSWLPGLGPVPLSASRPYQVIELTVPASLYPSVEIGLNPRRGLTGLPTWWWATGDARDGKTGTFQQGGITWEVWFRPTLYTWDFGDGSVLVTTSPGQPYPLPSDVRHMYERTSLSQPGQAYTVTLAVRFDIYVRPQGQQGWYYYGPYDGSGSIAHQVQQVQSVIGG